MDRGEEAIKSLGTAIRNIIFGASGGAAWFVISSDASLSLEIAVFFILAVLAGAVDYIIRVEWFPGDEPMGV